MKYSNRLKGSITQALVRSLLIDAGITVVPLGIEEVIRELSDMSQKQYNALNLPYHLKTLPDFFAINADRSESWCLEVKFRGNWNNDVQKELYNTLYEQVKSWSPLHLILFFGNTPSYFPENPSSWIRVAKLRCDNDKILVEIKGDLKDWFETEWTEFSRIQDVFSELSSPEKWEDAVLKLTISVSKELVELS